MAPGSGIDFLDKNLEAYLDIPKDVFYNYEDASAIGLLMKLFSSMGTSTWVLFPHILWHTVLFNSFMYLLTISVIG
jgi:hypothetical protein